MLCSLGSESHPTCTYVRVCVCLCLILSMYSCQLSAAAYRFDHQWWRSRGLHLRLPTHFNGCPPSEPHYSPKLNKSLPILLLQPVTACVSTSTHPHDQLCPLTGSMGSQMMPVQTQPTYFAPQPSTQAVPLPTQQRRNPNGVSVSLHV